MKDKYKHLLNFTANIISLAVEAAMFGWVWYMLYIPMLDKANTFFNRGNSAVERINKFQILKKKFPVSQKLIPGFFKKKNQNRIRPCGLVHTDVAAMI